MSKEVRLYKLILEASVLLKKCANDPEMLNLAKDKLEEAMYNMEDE